MAGTGRAKGALAPKSCRAPAGGGGAQLRRARAASTARARKGRDGKGRACQSPGEAVRGPPRSASACPRTAGEPRRRARPSLEPRARQAQELAPFAAPPRPPSSLMSKGVKGRKANFMPSIFRGEVGGEGRRVPLRIRRVHLLPYSETRTHRIRLDLFPSHARSGCGWRSPSPPPTSTSPPTAAAALALFPSPLSVTRRPLLSQTPPGGSRKKALRARQLQPMKNGDNALLSPSCATGDPFPFPHHLPHPQAGLCSIPGYTHAQPDSLLHHRGISGSKPLLNPYAKV